MTEADARCAARLAAAAAELLLDVRARDGGGDPATLGRRGDAEANALLLGLLARARPGDAVLSEEAVDDPVRLGAERVWIIDPLDGTREFVLPGRDDWAVHVALWEAGRGITAAAVALPALGVVYASDDPPPAGGPAGAPAVRAGSGAVPAGAAAGQVSAAGGPVGSGAVPAGGRTMPAGGPAVAGGAGVGVTVAGGPTIVVSDSRPPAFAAAVADRVGGRLASLGSAGAKAMAVVRGDAAAYLHSGGMWEWDSAAPVGVALAAGLHASRVDGSPLRYNQPHPYLPDLLICRPELAGPLLAAIAEHR